jgi:hypothetical protein
MSEREADEAATHGDVLRWSSESQEDTQVFSTVHRKDNSAWGKRMEKELTAIEKRAADKTKLGNSEGSKQTESGQDSDDERPIVQTLDKGLPKFGLLSIGTEIMKQFESGLFVDTVKAYDRKEDLYKIEYSDGDREEFDKEEFIYAYQLALEHGDDDEETIEQICQNDQRSSEEESAYVLPKV